MSWWWWWAWIVLIVIFALLPLLFVWASRRSGPPYPRYVRRRRARTMAPVREDPYRQERRDEEAREQAKEDAWTWLADLFWLGVLVALAWGIWLWLS